MVNAKAVEAAYQVAKERYAEVGVDTEAVLDKLQTIRVSLPCWQGDDIHGFLTPDAKLTGGIGVSGDFPGGARNPEELTSDLDEAFKLIPGKQRLQLHQIYAVTNGKKKDLSEVGPEDFKYWVDWAKENGVLLDFNPTFFSSPKVKENMTLSSPEKSVRDYWIQVGRNGRKISNYFGETQGVQSIDNFWIMDGMKDEPISRLDPRERLIESLDEINKEKFDEKNTIESYEGKLFGTGVESYTVGSHLFYNNYALTRNKLWCMDIGHFHEAVDPSDYLSSFLAFGRGMFLHVTRPVHWDSDHVPAMNDMLIRVMRALIRDNLLNKTTIGLDFFDGSINRVAAWVIGTRSAQKGLLLGMLAPIDELKEAERNYDFTLRLAETEELKSFPFGAVWDEFCLRNNVPVGMDWFKELKNYEANVQLKRN
ncbi:L-rhamnose isomerase [Lactobacillus colini]|uniref:L-rhamnose isomerase n=1 Tax=Lactobacillus colini TaxID=1819254 RepID=A0ABS4MBT5_9LACO|nr:L-rhamnose isomerase [Lactobacillus colini]MBP2057142.1 L-rhamnose isomerase [Lactobacillus colini]